MQKPAAGSEILTLSATSLLGFSTGWILGLSIAPGITTSVLTTILATIVALVGTLSGVKPADKDASVRVNPIPLSILMFGMALGVATGIWFRSHNLLGVAETEGQIDANIQQTILFSSVKNECASLVQSGLTYRDSNDPTQFVREVETSAFSFVLESVKQPEIALTLIQRFCEHVNKVEKR